MLKVGDKAPEFTCKDQDGKTFRLSEHLGKPLVLYFYPKDNTPGCTKQACSFRDDYGQFERKGIQIYGINPDSERSHKEFAEKYDLPFPLLSDPDKKISKLYGAARLWGLLPFVRRVTYLIDEKGVVQQVIHAEMDISRHMDVLKGSS